MQPVEPVPASVQPVFPRLRWVLVAFVAIWLPSYWVVWGWQNFLQLCDVTMVLTAVAVWRGDARLLSSQATGTLIVNALWVLDVGTRLLAGRHVVGGTEYMWNAAFPAWVRALSLFHLGLPIVHLLCLRRTGYDRRAWRLEAGIAAVVFVVARLLAAPGTNPNFLFTGPVFHHPVGPPVVHVLVVWLVQITLLMLPVHFALRRWLPAPRA